MMQLTGRMLLHKLFSPIRVPLQQLLDIAIYQQAREVAAHHPNPFSRFGRKIFSQADEDGLTLEILRRLDVQPGVFAEFGVGTGLENNTLALVALDWKGFWVGGESLAFTLPSGKRDFCHLERWITLDNVADLASEGLRAIAEARVDVISLDLDGNDIYLVERLLNSGHRPKLFIVEYNAKFPPPIRWHIEYDAQHQWKGDDYFGASLASYNDLFARNGYFLACCNSQTGANAFFVDDRFADRFPEVPKQLSQLYADPRYHLYENYGHPASVKTIETLFRRHRAARTAGTASGPAMPSS